MYHSITYKTKSVKSFNILFLVIILHYGMYSKQCAEYETADSCC